MKVFLSKMSKLFLLMSPVLAVALFFPFENGQTIVAVFAWTIGAPLLLSRKSPSLFKESVDNPHGGMPLWLMAGFAAPAMLCLVSAVIHVLLFGHDHLTSAMNMRGEDVKLYHIAGLALVSSLLYGCFGALFSGIIRATIGPYDYRVRRMAGRGPLESGQGGGEESDTTAQ